MEILRFRLSGKHAFFKKPEVNNVYFTYGNIHKVALLGIFGAILGYGGYTQMQNFKKKKKKQTLEQSFPEFYEKLEDLKISILPVNEKGFISKKIQIFNNSVGYACKEKGGNLIVKEQWLENPQWEICVCIDSEEAEKIKEAICGHRCVYYPYLGKNEHFADISHIVVENANVCEFKMGKFDCFAPTDMVEIVDLDEDEEEELELFGLFQYKEALPYQMDSWTNQYILKSFIYTDNALKLKEDCAANVYQLNDGKKIIFY